MLEVAGTPLLDLQSDPSFTGYFQGLNNVNVRDFMNADAVGLLRVVAVKMQ